MNAEQRILAWLERADFDGIDDGRQCWECRQIKDWLTHA